MEDLIILRKKRGNSTSFKGFQTPVMSVRFPRGEFVFNKLAAEQLKMNNSNAYMFALSKKQECAFIYEESPEPDSYYPKNSKDGIYRFTSKDLATLFSDFFGIDKKTHFEITSCKEEALFKITIKK